VAVYQTFLHEMSNIPYPKCQTLPTDKGEGRVYENDMILVKEVMAYKNNGRLTLVTQ